MLVNFRVKNFALIDEIDINFKKGLNVLSGETGAGKSIIIAALEILLGARASSDLIRKKQDKAYIEAVFQPSLLTKINDYLEKIGVETDSQILLLSREIKRDASNLNRINGQLATASMIKGVSKYLVDIHGQHEHQSLLDLGAQLKLLDEFIGENNLSLKTDIAHKFQEILDVEQELKELEIDEGEKVRQIDIYQFQLDEIEQAQLEEEEMEKLYAQYQVLTNMEEIYKVMGDLSQSLNGDDYQVTGIVDNLGIYYKDLEKIKDYDPNINNFYQELKDIYYQLQDLSLRLGEYQQNLEFEQDKLDKIEARMSLINSLQRKYGNTIKDVLAYSVEVSQKLKNLKEQEQLSNKLENKLKNLKKDYFKQAKKLSVIRQKKAKVLEVKIMNELKDLAIKQKKLKIHFTEKKPNAKGIDKIEFLIAPNLGEELKSLIKIVSGGELSRIMLAVKTIISHLEQVDTMVFDEVDSGIGGKTAQKMAEKLAIISKKRQVICITHLPQIASMADSHFLISKKTDSKHTFSTIEPLNQQEKKEELTRMLGGVELTKTTLNHAEEMLKLAKNKKKNL